MYRVKIKDAVNEEAGVFPQEYIGSCIYVVRDGGVIFYVGQSEDPLYRLQQLCWLLVTSVRRKSCTGYLAYLFQKPGREQACKN
jgi:hypothetical protein